MLFSYLIFPGFLFSAIAGLLAGWVDRKVTARLQYRVGPPVTQNFWDILKLLGREIILPENASRTFVIAPYFGLIGAALLSALLGRPLISNGYSFTADIIVVLYLMLIPAVALILGASSSRNPLASVGASREMKLILAYELPFLLSVIAVIVRSGYSLELGKILEHQQFVGSNIFSPSGALAFLAAIFCMQAKLGVTPFDASEAEQEIMAGVLIEYSGPLLAAFKLAKAIMLYIMPVFIITLFLGRDTSVLFMLLKYVCILTVIILIKNTSPRLRIDQAIRFFWRMPTLLGIVAIILALMGL